MHSTLAYLAFESLIGKLTNTRPISIADINSFSSIKRTYPDNAPLFVTWNKSGNLRGCIGTFEELPIEEAVAKYALISAFEDERFQPMTELELPQLSVGITILDKFLPIYDPLDWTIGKHGLKIQFQTEKGHFLGTFLPLVAEDQKWDKVETLWNLLRKAGYRGPSIDKTVDFYETLLDLNAMKLVRYDGIKTEASYEEYASFKTAITKQS